MPSASSDCAGAVAQFVQVRQHLLVRQISGHGQVGARRLILYLCGGIAVGTQHTGTRGHDYRPGVGENSQCIGMQRAGTAKADKGEIPGS
jgi:hypothetical protein